MASKGIFTTPREWWKHLRETKREFWKGERRAAKKYIQSSTALDDKELAGILAEISRQKPTYPNAIGGFIADKRTEY